MLTRHLGLHDSQPCLASLAGSHIVQTHRGFPVNDAQLNIPAFIMGKKQLDPVDVEKPRKIASVRIHVERIIGVLRQKYTIFQSTLPTDYLICQKGDKMIRGCSALVLTFVLLQCHFIDVLKLCYDLNVTYYTTIIVGQG